MYIRKEDVWKYGTTPRCGGCKFAMGERKNIEGHSRECKERMKEAMKNDVEDASRVDKDDKRQAKVKEDEEEREKDKRKIEETSQRQRKKSRIEERQEEKQTASSSSKDDTSKEGGDKRKKEEGEDENDRAKRTKNESSCMFLTERNGNGEVYDFSRIDHRNMVMREVLQKAPVCIVANGIHERMGENAKDPQIAKLCCEHLKFLGQLYAWQEKNERYFILVVRAKENDEIWKGQVAKDKQFRSMKSKSKECLVEGREKKIRITAGTSLRRQLKTSSTQLLEPPTLTLIRLKARQRPS
jgi:hypothetical protein